MLVEDVVIMHLVLACVGIALWFVFMMVFSEEKNVLLRRIGTWVAFICLFAGVWEIGNAYEFDARVDQKTKDVNNDAVIASFFLAPRAAWKLVCYIVAHRADIWEWIVQTSNYVVTQVPKMWPAVSAAMYDGVSSFVGFVVGIPAFFWHTVQCIVLADCFQK